MLLFQVFIKSAELFPTQDREGGIQRVQIRNLDVLIVDIVAVLRERDRPPM
jgi:hypothetical protein